MNATHQGARATERAATGPDSSVAAAAAASTRRTVAATALGNGLEFFDFTVYSFFAATIGKLFFPVGSELGALMLSLATFGVGFVVRPLGSIAIGAYADRAGRKPALILTVTLMALGTGLIGLAPTYETIGVAAPLLVVFGRLLQGFSAGGEVGAATALLMESASAGKRGALVSWQMATQGGAALAGAMVAATLSRVLSPEALVAWGWRAPFIIGLLIGPVGFYLRCRLKDTLPEAHAIRAHERSGEQDVKPHRRLPLRQIAAGTMLVVGGTATMYTVVFFLPSFLTLSLHMPAAISLLAGCTSGLILLLGSPLAGKLADRVRRRKTLPYLASVVSMAALLPCFYLIQVSPAIVTVIAVVSLLVGLMTLSSPAGFVLILESLRPETRATSLGIIYAIGVSLFGGFAQLIVSALYRWSGSFYAPAWYMLACGAISLCGITLYKESPPDAAH